MAYKRTSPQPVVEGGTGAQTFTDGAVLLGSGTGAITALDVTAKGSLLIGDGATDPVALAVGTDTHVLTVDSAEDSGAKWAASAGGGSGWVFLSSATASTSSTIDFTSSIDSTYFAYAFVFDGIATSNNAVSMRMRTSTDGGSTFDSGASDYKWVIFDGSFFSDSSDDRISFFASQGNASNEVFCAVVYMLNPSNTATYKNFIFDCNGRNSSSALSSFSVAGGFRKSTADVDAVRFYPSAGTFASGTIKLYGVGKPS